MIKINKTLKLEKLKNTLKHVPEQTELTIQEYLHVLTLLMNDFREELDHNMKLENSYSYGLDYIEALFVEFNTMYMTLDGKMDVLLFPDIIATEVKRKNKTILSIVDAHKHIYLLTINILELRLTLLYKKIEHKIPLVSEMEKELSKYILNEGNLTNWVEMGHAIYQVKILNTRIGDKMQLYQFVKDFCVLVGESNLDVKRKLEELKGRSNPNKFLEYLLCELKKVQN